MAEREHNGNATMKNVFNWSRRVPQKAIADLYGKTAGGIWDEELIDEVGCGLYARCESIVAVTRIYESKTLPCPDCGKPIPAKDGMFACTCGFCTTWDIFKSSYKNKQLYAANAMQIFLDFIRDYPKAKEYGQKLICIDVLIHSFHMRNAHGKPIVGAEPTDEGVFLNRPTGANLIEGGLHEVIDFLDKLSSIEGYSQGKQYWSEHIAKANGGSSLR